MMKRLLKWTGFCVVCVLSASVKAETTGLLDGRSASPEEVGAKSLEIGYVSEDDVTSIGGRFNFQYSPALGLYADYLQVDEDFINADGDSIGLGFRYALMNQRFLPNMDAAVRGSYHIQSLDLDAGAEAEVTELAVALHISSKQPFASNWRWYGLLSYQQYSAEIVSNGITFEDDDTETGFGAGIFAPFAGGEAYIGAEKVEDTYLGIGYRHFLGGSRR